MTGSTLALRQAKSRITRIRHRNSRPSRSALLFAVVLGSVTMLTPMLCAATAGHALRPGLRGSTNGRSPGYLGIKFHDLPPDGSTLLRRNAQGVEVVMVDHDGPAGKAGLRPHDVIVGLNGQAIASAEALRRMIHDAGAGMEIALSILRGGKALTLNAQLANPDDVARAAMARLAASDAPAPLAAPSQPATPDTEISATTETYPVDGAPASEPALASGPVHGQSFIGSMLHSGPITGAVLDAMEPQLASFFGAPQGIGLLVHSVTPGSSAAGAGLRAGDVILRADSAFLHSPADWTKRVHAAKGRPIALSVLRDRHELTLTLQPEPKHHSLVEWPSLF